MFKGLFNGSGSSQKTPSPAEVEAFCAAVGANREEEALNFVARFGKEAIDLPHPKSGYTALMCGARHGRKRLCSQLIDAGAGVNVKDKDGWTALRIAVGQNQYETIGLLLDRGADINLGTKEGWTPLMAAAREGSEAAVKLLLSRGADPMLKNTSNETAADTAGSGHPAVVSILRQAMADERTAAERTEAAAAEAKVAETEKSATQIARDFTAGLEKPIGVSPPVRFKT